MFAGLEGREIIKSYKNIALLVWIKYRFICVHLCPSVVLISERIALK
ncbi:hypothetical protein NIES4073_36940 [Kalymmatonema gypsitolerans NIES-4073]|nr:hypothetical protein NIES4073_36940 [Scytonema sp. NIES-4073]